MTDGSSTLPGSTVGKMAPGSGGSGGSGVSGQRVVREVGVEPANWPILTKVNYTEWALIMKIKLQARNLWDAIETRDVMLQEDRMALDAITSTVPQEMLASLAVKKSVAEKWEAVTYLRIGSEAVRNARTQRLRAEFESIRFKEGEVVDDFTMRLDSMVVALGTLGEEIKVQQVVQKVLRVVPKHLSYVAITIEVTQDLSKLTLKDVGGRLRGEEDHAKEEDALPSPRVDGKLLLTEEQWKEKTPSAVTLGRAHPAAASGDARASAATVGRRARSVTISVTTAAAPAIGQEIAASQRMSGRI
jgi:hypothetical protein